MDFITHCGDKREPVVFVQSLLLLSSAESTHLGQKVLELGQYLYLPSSYISTKISLWLKLARSMGI